MSADLSGEDLIHSSPPPTVAADSTVLYQSPISVTILVSIVALLLAVSFAALARQWFAGNHEEAADLRRPATAASPDYSRRVSAPPPGLDALAVAELPVVMRFASGGEGCPVCLEEYGDKEMVKVIPGCGHAFHPECIDAWLKWRGSCPVCRCSELWSSDSLSRGEEGEHRIDMGGCRGVREGTLENDGMEAMAEEDESNGTISLRRTCSV